MTPVGNPSPGDRFCVLFEHSSDAHLIFDETGTTDCNDACVELLKAEDKAQVLAQHPAALSPELQPNGIRSMEKSMVMDAIARTRGYHRFDWVGSRRIAREQLRNRSHVEVAEVLIDRFSENVSYSAHGWHRCFSSPSLHSVAQVLFDEPHRKRSLEVARQHRFGITGDVRVPHRCCGDRVQYLLRTSASCLACAMISCRKIPVRS